MTDHPKEVIRNSPGASWKDAKTGNYYFSVNHHKSFPLTRVPWGRFASVESILFHELSHYALGHVGKKIWTSRPYEYQSVDYTNQHFRAPAGLQRRDRSFYKVGQHLTRGRARYLNPPPRDLLKHPGGPTPGKGSMLDGFARENPGRLASERPYSDSQTGIGVHQKRAAHIEASVSAAGGNKLSDLSDQKPYPPMRRVVLNGRPPSLMRRAGISRSHGVPEDAIQKQNTAGADGRHDPRQPAPFWPELSPFRL